MAEVLRPIPGLIWDTPPECQGQIVEVSYAADAEAEMLWRRVWDHSDGSVQYDVCAYQDLPKTFDLDRDWQPWNGEPKGIPWQRIRVETTEDVEE